MYQRTLSNNIVKRLGSGKAIVLLGPRQVGKTTLIKNLVGLDNYLFLDGDDPQIRALLDQPNTADIKNIIDEKLIGIILSCVSPENYEINLNELKSLKVPFGFKINGFITTKPRNGYSSTFTKLNGNPNEFLGKRTDLTPKKFAEFAKKFKESGATILGGCCETGPKHIKEIFKLK